MHVVCELLLKSFNLVISLRTSIILSLSFSLRFRVTCLLWWSQCFLMTSGLWLPLLPRSKASSSHQACPTSQVHTHTECMLTRCVRLTSCTLSDQEQDIAWNVALIGSRKQVIAQHIRNMELYTSVSLPHTRINHTVTNALAEPNVCRNPNSRHAHTSRNTHVGTRSSDCSVLVLHTFLSPMHSSRCSPDATHHWPLVLRLQ